VIAGPSHHHHDKDQYPEYGMKQPGLLDKMQQTMETRVILNSGHLTNLGRLMIIGSFNRSEKGRIDE